MVGVRLSIIVYHVCIDDPWGQLKRKNWVVKARLSIIV